MVRTRRLWTSLRAAGLPQEGHGAFLGQQRTRMVSTWGLMVSMACVLRWWLGQTLHQHAGPNFLGQDSLCYSNELSASPSSGRKILTLGSVLALQHTRCTCARSSWQFARGVSPASA